MLCKSTKSVVPYKILHKPRIQTHYIKCHQMPIKITAKHFVSDVKSVFGSVLNFVYFEIISLLIKTIIVNISLC